MTTDFSILLLCAAGAAYAAYASIRLKAPVVATATAVLVFVLVAMHTVVVAIFSGDGRILPGKQFHPGLKAIWGESLVGWLNPVWALAALVAHAMLVFAKPSRAAVWRLAPVSLLFVGLYLVLDGRTQWPKSLHMREPGVGRDAYLTVAPRGDGKQSRLVFAVGTDDEAFLDVVFVHESEAWPPVEPRPPRLFWTKDGSGVVFMVLRHKLLGIEPDSGKIVGGLPVSGNTWPRPTNAAMSSDALKRLKESMAAVDRWIAGRGGLLGYE